MVMPTDLQKSEEDEPETVEQEKGTGLPAVMDEDEDSELPSIPDADENTGDAADFYTVTVPSGAVCRDIAEELMELGLVEDSEDFRLYMDQNGYDNMIRTGEFQIPREASYEEIARILTRNT
jgi:cell division protein YceG involved in septum cleavage